jgi:nucleoside-diphosphate-sugar epimerase
MVGRALIRRFSRAHDICRVGREADADLRLDLLEGWKGGAALPACDALVHCAASFAPDTREGCAQNELVNAVGALHVANLALDLHCRQIIYLSSTLTARHSQNEYFGSYGLSKLHGAENLQLVCAREGMRLCVLLIPQVYDSAGEFSKHQPLLRHILAQAAKGEDTIFFGQKDVARCFIHLDDLAEILLRLVDRSIEGTWVCPGWTHTLSEWASLAYQAAGTYGAAKFDGARPDIRSVWVSGDVRLLAQIEYELQVPPLTGFRSFFNSMQGK